jgi:single-stranded-DNA-specific exonuclease
MILLKYKLIGGNYTFMPTETVLENRSITKDLFNLDESVIEDYNNYDNMQEGIELLLKHLDNKSNIVMVVDSDFDGHSSFAIIYRRIKRLFPNANIQILTHNGKEHGLSSDIQIEDNINLVILTDSSSNDFEQHKQLKDKGIDILVIDHHICDGGYSPYATVINNQLSNKVYNKNGCGAFVCYKFIKALDEYIFDDISDEYIDLVGFANVADMMDLREKESRYFVYRGLKNINNPFLQALMEVKSYELENKLNINSIGWVLAPMINACVRSATQEEKLKMVEAFISNDYEFCLEVAKMCKNVKVRQDNAVKSALKKLELKIKMNSNDRCIILDVGKALNKNHTGLVATKIADKYKVPTLLYRDVEDKKGYVGGSFRGIDSISKDTRIDILNSGLVTYSQGHGQAGGWACNKDNLPKLKGYLNNLYKDKEIIDSKEYIVDFILQENEIDEGFINELSQLEDEWGNGIDTPLIAFENINLNLTDENLKGKLNIVFYINDVKFIKKFSTNILKEQLINKNIAVNVVGKCTVDKYNNCGMVEIVDLEIL